MSSEPTLPREATAPGLESGSPNASSRKRGAPRKGKEPHRAPECFKGHATEKKQQKGKEPKIQPTHFIALPLNRHESLRNDIASFQSSILAHEPPIKGLDKSIVIDPRRIHITLGVMALEKDLEKASPPPQPASTGGEPQEGGVVPAEGHGEDAPTPKLTISSALALLESLKPQISTILTSSATTESKKVYVPLDVLDVFPPGSTEKANVLWVGPDPKKQKVSRSEEWKVLWRICDLIHTAFKSQKYITDTRPLKLHCTLLNTSHRKPRRGGGFSFKEVGETTEALESFGVNGIDMPRLNLGDEVKEGPASQPGSSLLSSVTTAAPVDDIVALPRHADTPGRWPKSSPIPVNLGSWEVGTAELWVMGSRGANNEYVSVGGIKLK
ncbi:hypothetical protein DFP72DRAFT_1103285 [Ephemerocybe angulata]|uniref:A-kinase anchor protein 7-like phosphoesterase domain-containing protein n=1 Tax=Ephemerocybe angulata TaxID=980116 RepID=A0A8H6HBL5_9AGAR|nr:hypothetical protein DFP72DRAFT_1103285 [Tulosesus angulatus]